MYTKESLKSDVLNLYKKNKNLTYRDVSSNKEILKHYNSSISLRKRLYELGLKDKSFAIDIINLSKGLKSIPSIEKNVKHEEPTKEFNKKEALDMFKKQYHKKTISEEKIKKGIDTYLKKRGFIPDAEFRQLCGVSTIDWKYSIPKFQNLQVTVDHRIIWGHPSIISNMKKIVESNAKIY